VAAPYSEVEGEVCHPRYCLSEISVSVIVKLPACVVVSWEDGCCIVKWTVSLLVVNAWYELPAVMCRH